MSRSPQQIRSHMTSEQRQLNRLVNAGRRVIYLQPRKATPFQRLIAWLALFLGGWVIIACILGAFLLALILGGK